MTIRLPACPCPFCKAELDAASWADDGAPAAPVAGDVSVCAYCQCLLIFDGDPLRVRAPTVAELGDLVAIPAVQRTLKALARAPPPDSGS